MSNNTKSSSSKPTPASRALTDELLEIQGKLRLWFNDDFNTPAVLHSLSSLAGHGLAYGQDIISGKCQPIEPLITASEFVQNTLILLGVKIGSIAGSSAKQNGQKEMNALIKFRSLVRDVALQSVKKHHKSSSDTEESLIIALNANKEILQLSDHFRDIVAPSIGYEIRDMGSRSIVTKIGVHSSKEPSE